MKKILYITVSPRGEKSKSNILGNHYLDNLDDYDIELLDLSLEDVPFLTNDIISYMYSYKKFEDLSKDDKYIAKIQEKFIKQLKNVDRVLISVPMWNFSEPAVLKAYFDLVLKVNDTFEIGEKGYVPLLTNIKRVDIVGSRGGYYKRDFKSADLLEPQTKNLMNFITGAYIINTYWLEGVNMVNKEKLDTEINLLKQKIVEEI